MKISGKTHITGLFGYPVEHSLSPAMHNAAFEYLNMDYCYVAFSVRPDLLANAVAAIRALDLRGVNITVPHKEKVISFLDNVDEEAAFIGAVNTVLNNGGLLTGYNTDGRGFIAALPEAGISISGKTVLIIGAGGASRAVSYYVAKEAEQLLIFDIDATKAGRLAADLRNIKLNVKQVYSLTDMGNADILINASPLGLKDTDPSPIDTTMLRPGIAVCDLIYKDTLLLKSAANTGCRTMNGLSMLLHQGALSFEIWTGTKPPVDIMRSAIRLY